VGKPVVVLVELLEELLFLKALLAIELFYTLSVSKHVGK
jgi:hypothetical protein